MIDPNKVMADWVHACACAIGCGLDAFWFTVKLESRTDDEAQMEVTVNDPYATADLVMAAQLINDPERMRRLIAHELCHCLLWDLKARDSDAEDLFCDRFAFLMHDLMPMPPSLADLGVLRASTFVPGSDDLQ